MTKPTDNIARVVKVILAVLALLCSLPGHAFAQDSKSFLLSNFVAGLLESIGQDGKFDASHFDCNSILDDADGSGLLDCYDAATGIRSLWAMEPSSDNIAVSIVQSGAPLNPRQLTANGDLLVRNQTDFEEWSIAVIEARDFLFDNYITCENEQGLTVTPNAASRRFIVKNEKTASRITVFLSDYSQDGPGFEEAQPRSEQTTIVGTLLIINQIDVRCGALG